MNNPKQPQIRKYPEHADAEIGWTAVDTVVPVPWNSSAGGIVYGQTGLQFAGYPSSVSMTHNSQAVFFDLLSPVLEKLQSHIYALTQDRDEAKDIVGNAILRAFDNFGSLTNHAAFELWMFRTARNEFFRTWRRKKLFVRFGRYDENIETDAADGAEAQYDRNFLLQCIGRLPAKEAEAVSLYSIAGFSYEEIWNIQGGSLSGVKSRIKRGRERLLVMMRDSVNRGGGK